MINRAKCKLCNSIIESYHATDLVVCKCGEISVDGGEALRCYAIDWKNFLRVDDQGNEIIVKVKNDNVNPLDNASSKPTKKVLIGMLDEMIKNIEGLPQIAMTAPITHYDFASALILLASILRASDDAWASETCLTKASSFLASASLTFAISCCLRADSNSACCRFSSFKKKS